MDKVKKNVLANYIGRVWTSLVGIIFIPVYINILGIESYGVIGFYASLCVALTFLDFGLSQTLTREAAISSSSQKEKNEFFALIGSLEYVYWLVAVLAIFVFWIGSSSIASSWLQPETISNETLGGVICVMGFVAALQWAGGIYRSVLIGVQEQVWLNILEIIITTLRSFGVIGVLLWISPTLEGFFYYQAGVVVVEIIVLRQKVMSLNGLSRVHVPRFDLYHLLRIWKFAGGVTVISVTGTLVSQLDKLILPGIISLKAYGYYMVANVVGRSISRLVYPIAIAYRPVFANLVAQGKELALAQQYHKSSQIMGVLIIPVAVILAIFSADILYLWTRNSELVSEVSAVMSLLALGTMFNGLVNLPYSILLAYGWLKPALYINVISALVLVPIFIQAVTEYGIIAVGWIWLSLNLLYISINISIIHSRYLIGEGVIWYKKDIVPVLISSFAMSILINYIFEDVDSTIYIMIKIGLACLLTFVVAMLSVEHTRKYVASFFRRII